MCASAAARQATCTGEAPRVALPCAWACGFGEHGWIGGLCRDAWRGRPEHSSWLGRTASIGVPPTHLQRFHLASHAKLLLGTHNATPNARTRAPKRTHRLSELTRLTHLALRCDPDGAVAAELRPWDAQRLCTALGPRLRRLELALPASCLTAEVLSGSLELLVGLRALVLAADPHVRQVPLSRWELRGELLTAAAAQCVGTEWGAAVGAGNGGGAAAGAAAPSPAVLAEVNAALTPLLFLQELFTAMEDVEGVRQSLEAEAEWRTQHLQEVHRRLAAAKEQVAAAEEAVAAAQVAALEALAAAAAVTAGDAVAAAEPAAALAAMRAVEAAVEVLHQAGEEMAEAVAVAAAAADMPRLPHWVLADEQVGGEWDLAAAAALAWISPAAYSDAAAAPPPPPPAPRPLNELSNEELHQLRRMLVREEAVTGPVFRMGAWLPPRIEALRLRGFAGVEAPPPPRPKRALPVLPALAEVCVELPDAAAVAEAERVLRELSAAGVTGAAPALRVWRAVQVGAADAAAEAEVAS